ncbi:MAG: hypothetical protein AAGJ35_12020 [Myxococcota bacterium]
MGRANQKPGAQNPPETIPPVKFSTPAGLKFLGFAGQSYDLRKEARILMPCPMTKAAPDNRLVHSPKKAVPSNQRVSSKPEIPTTNIVPANQERCLRQLCLHANPAKTTAIKVKPHSNRAWNAATRPKEAITLGKKPTAAQCSAHKELATIPARSM